MQCMKVVLVVMHVVVGDSALSLTSAGQSLLVSQLTR